MEATNNPTEGINSVDYKNCINFSGENLPETASINFDQTEEVNPGELCIYRVEGMSKFGLAHLSEKTDNGVIFEFTEGEKKRKGESTPIEKVKTLHRVKSISVDYN